jgi:hypothetical protein
VTKYVDAGTPVDFVYYYDFEKRTRRFLAGLKKSNKASLSIPHVHVAQ